MKKSSGKRCTALWALLLSALMLSTLGGTTLAAETDGEAGTIEGLARLTSAQTSSGGTMYFITFYADIGDRSPYMGIGGYDGAVYTLPTPQSLGYASGYEFLGWSTQPFMTNSLLRAGRELTLRANVSYYAIWKKVCASDARIAPYPFSQVSRAIEQAG